MRAERKAPVASLPPCFSCSVPRPLLLSSSFLTQRQKQTPRPLSLPPPHPQVLTPEEFVRAGDFLVRACPTWSWEAGDPARARSFLPRGKQYLATRGVPSRRRASAVEGYGGGGDGGDGGGRGDGRDRTTVEAGGMEGDDEGWVAPPPAGDGDAGLDAAAEHGAEAGAGGGPAAAAAAAAAAPKEAEEEEGDQEDDGEDIPDLDDLEIVDEGDIDEAALPPAAVAASAAARAAKKAAAESERSPKQKNSNVVPVRTYDLSISYDKYYQVPRFWLAGFDEDRRPLRADALLEDGERREKTFFFLRRGGKTVSKGKSHLPSLLFFPQKKSKKTVAAEHARKTVTVEPHPHAPAIRVASIHPCRHAAVMKKLASMGAAGAGGSGSSSGRATEAPGSATASAEAGATETTAAPLDPEAYLVLFLKFIASVIPTIEYDFTMHAAVGGGGR